MASPVRWRRLAAFVLVVVASGCSQLLTDTPRRTEVIVAVKDAGGAPMPDLPLILYTGDRPVQYASTGEDGRFRFEEVPYGVYGVSVDRPPSYVDLGEPINVFVDGLLINATPLDTIRFVLAKCEGTVSVQVLDATGNPASSLPVYLYRLDGIVRDTITGVDGTVNFTKVHCGDYGVAVPPTYGYVIKNVRGFGFADGLRITRATTSLRAVLRVTVEDCGGVIRVHAQDTGGAPVPGASLLLYSGDAKYRTAVTDGAGNASFARLACSPTLGVLITPPPGYSVPAGGDRFDRISPAATTNLTFTLTPK